MPSAPIDVVISSGNAETDAYLSRLISEQLPAYRAATAADEQEYRERFPQAQVILAWAVPARAFDHVGRLEWLQVIGTGVDAVAAVKDRLRGVTVTNVRGVFSGPIAEYVLAYTLAHFQGIRRILQQQGKHVWKGFVPSRFEGKTFGIVGLGSIGSEIARRASLLGARVVGMRRTAASVPHVERVYALDELRDFFGRCEVLVLALPGTPQTRGFMSIDRLAMLKPECFVVNVGRGEALPTDHLVEALERRLIAGAAIDVFDQEPLPSGSPLWDYAGVFVTPHLSGVNRPEDLAAPILENLRRFSAAEPLLNVVDLDRGY